MDKTMFHPCQLGKVLHVLGSDEFGTVASRDHYHFKLYAPKFLHAVQISDLQHDQEHLE